MCSSLKSNEQSNMFVLISIYRPNLYVTIEEVTCRSLQNLRNDFYFILNKAGLSVLVKRHGHHIM
jgi:hypothetical protein